MKKRIIAGTLGVLLSVQSHATDLMEIYEQALSSDPIFKQAYSTYMSNKEALPQARAALLPSLLGTGGQISKTQNQFGQNSFTGGVIPLRQSFYTYAYNLTATQAIFNYQSWMQIKLAKDSVKAAQATFNSSAQDLILRTAQAYFNVLLAKDTLRFTQAEKRANKRQLEQAQQRYKVGLDAITSVYEAKAAYDETVAREIADKNNLINRFEDLRKLTNHTYESLAPLRNGKIPLINPEPNNVNEWVDVALKQNYQLLSAKYSALAAKKNIQVQAGQNYPTINVQGNYQDSKTNAITVVGNQKTASVTLNLSFPIYQGGLVLSQTRQANYDYQTASEAFEESYRNTLVNTRIAYNNILDGIEKIKADRQAIISAENSLSSTEAQFKVGTRTMVDVLDAQQRLFRTQLQLSTDQYTYIQSILLLKQSAGTLNANDLAQINSWLSTNRSFSPGAKPTYKKNSST